MTEADRIFERFPDFIREYIFSHRWDSLRAVQVAAAALTRQHSPVMLPRHGLRKTISPRHSSMSCSSFIRR